MANTQEIKTVSYGEYKRELYKLQEKYEGPDSHISILSQIIPAKVPLFR